MNNLALPKPCQSRSGLSCSRLQEIEIEAERVVKSGLEQLSVLGLGADEFTDINFVASLLTGSNPEPRPNLKLNGERVAGLLQKSGSGAEILYESFHPVYRQRFSVAHELGHFYLHAGEGSGTYHRCPIRSVDLEITEAVDDAEDSERENVSVMEAEADAFAGAFLLPTANFVSAINLYGNASEFLAQLFLVSKGAVRNRIDTLKLIGVLPEAR